MTTADRENARREMGDALLAIVYSASPALDLEFANRYAREYLGLGEEDLTGHRWLELIHPEDRAEVVAAWAAATATGQHYRHEHRIRMGDGAYRRFRAEALPLRAADGVIIHWYGVLTPLEGPRPRGPQDRPAKIDYYPLRDEAGELRLVAVAAWDRRPMDPAAKLHPCGIWYRVAYVDGE